MNCQECRSLVERFLDHALTGFAKRKVNLHLSRCATCRAYFDRRSENQALAYHAMNAALAGERLPEGFAKRFRDAHIVPERRFRLFRFGRRWKAAAALAAMVTFVGLAAVVISERRSAELKDFEVANPPQTAGAEKETEATEGTDNVSITSSDPYVSSVSQQTSMSQPKEGEQNMTMRRPAMAALSAALAAAPLAAANGDEYQFIISGDPVAAETAGISASSSETVPLTVGTLSGGFVHESEFEARSRTVDESSTNALRSDKFKGIIISVK